MDILIHSVNRIFLRCHIFCEILLNRIFKKFQIKVTVQKEMFLFHPVRLTENLHLRPCWCLKSLYTQENVKSVFISAA